ncbi:S9 family peptidase [Sediminitomix flava]|uniref:Proline-specific endopeptidase n=1 Tax=Sediminitomix flava TaxID=379075 RepID=A0A315Z1G3_SEDFL|nr:S9 family peptidase [Sediminitomix flava]PWJ36145.1 oligopeptidase B [Sediminitomix flava]
MKNLIQAPVAKKEEKVLEIHGHKRVDPYYWMREREDKEVLAYLEAENSYTAEVMAPFKSLEDKLFAEIKGRIQEKDMSVPYLLNGYYYYTRYEEGQEYPIYCRKKGSLEVEEQVILNVNEKAKGHSFYTVGGMSISSENDILAFAADTKGRRIYTIYFVNLETGEQYTDTIENVTGDITWANDNKTLFYTRQDEETLRAFQVLRHKLGEAVEEDVLVYEEKDETFTVYVHRTKSKKFIVLGSYSTLSTESQLIPADQPEQEPRIFLPREAKHEYSIAHYENSFYIVTNWKAQNFRLMVTDEENTAKSAWKEVIGHREDVLLEGLDIFKNYLVVEERKEGLAQIRIIKWDGSGEYYLDFGEPTYTAGTSLNPDFNTDILRYQYNSLTTPASVFDFDMNTKEKTLLKQQEVLGDFDAGAYTAERIYAEAEDGAKIPISLVYKNGLEKDGNNPVYLTAYGAYGYSYDPYFSSVRLSLLDRGFVFAIAHVRGGEEMGRKWYEDGKMMHKKNTFTDFIASAEALIAAKFTSTEKLVVNGGSAGGLLMGAVVNLRPDLFKVVVSEVPFVDVITTMLDTSIPLTTGEYDEWGNPNEKESYDYMLSYSPYDQVEAKSYPSMLVTSGLHDSQVQYWEPTKWVAKLRDLKTDHNTLLLKTNMDAGHGGASGRFERYREVAFEFAYVLAQLGIVE